MTSALPKELITNLRTTFKCIQYAGLNFSIAKCQFGTEEVNFNGRTITPNGATPKKIIKFLEKLKLLRAKKAKKNKTIYCLPELLPKLHTTVSREVKLFPPALKNNIN